MALLQCRQAVRERVDGEIFGLCSGGSFRDVPLEWRAQDEYVAAHIGSGLGHLSEVFSSPLAGRSISGCEVEALGFRKQPVQPDDANTGHLGLFAKLGTTGGTYIGDAWREREWSHFEAGITQLRDPSAHPGMLPALERLVADGVFHGSVSSRSRGVVSVGSSSVSFSVSCPRAAL